MCMVVLLVQTIFIIISWKTLNSAFIMIYAWLGIILLSFGILRVSKMIPVPHLVTFSMLLGLAAIYGF
jgi:hypothetical protein